MGWKVVTILGSHGWGGAPRRSQPNEASLKRRSGQLTGHCCVSVTSHDSLSFARVFQPCHFKHSKEFKAFKQKMRKSWTEYMCTMFGAHAESRVSRTETPSSPSRHLNETNTIPSLNMQTEKDVKEPNSAPAHHEQRDASQSASMPNSFLLALVPTNTYKVM